MTDKRLKQISDLFDREIELIEGKLATEIKKYIKSAAEKKEKDISKQLKAAIMDVSNRSYDRVLKNSINNLMNFNQSKSDDNLNLSSGQFVSHMAAELQKAFRKNL